MASHIIAVSILANFISFSDEKTISGLAFPVHQSVVAGKDSNSNSQNSTTTVEPPRPTSTNNNNKNFNHNYNYSNDSKDNKSLNQLKPQSQPLPPPSKSTPAPAPTPTPTLAPKIIHEEVVNSSNVVSSNPPSLTYTPNADEDSSDQEPSPTPTPTLAPEIIHDEVVNSNNLVASNPPWPTYTSYADEDLSDPEPSQGDVVPKFPKKIQKSKSAGASSDDPLIITMLAFLAALVILAIAVYIIRKVNFAPSRNMKKRMHEDLSYVFEPTPHNNANWPFSPL